MKKIVIGIVIVFCIIAGAGIYVEYDNKIDRSLTIKEGETVVIDLPKDERLLPSVEWRPREYRLYYLTETNADIAPKTFTYNCVNEHGKPKGKIIFKEH